jgi:hypothetical protein
VLSDTHVFGPSLVNVAKIAFNRSYVWLQDWNTSDVISQIGLQGISNPSQQAALSGMPDFEIGGNNGMAGTGVWSGVSSTAQNTYQFTDDISWAFGRHFLKAGVDVDSFQVNNASMPQSVRGSFSFDDQMSGFAYANFLLGLPSNVSQAIAGPNAYMRSTRETTSLHICPAQRGGRILHLVLNGRGGILHAGRSSGRAIKTVSTLLR